MFRRDRFGEVIARQFDLFESEHPADLREIGELFEKWNATERDEAEEAFGDYVDAVDSVAETLTDMRDRFASTLAEPDAERYESEFTRAARRRFPTLSRALER